MAEPALCSFFAQGRCAFGTACRDRHAVPGATAAAPAAARRPPPPHPPPPRPQQSPQQPQPPPQLQPQRQQDQGRGNAEQWDQAVASTWAREEEASTDTREANLRESRKLQKAVREIEALEEKRATGQTLQGNQLKKIEKKDEYHQRLAELEEMMRDQEPAETVSSLYFAAASSPAGARPSQQLQYPELLASQGGYPAAPPPPPSLPFDRPRAAANSHGVDAAPNTPVCRHFLAGRCSFGDACRQSHNGAGRSLGATPQRGRLEPSFDVEDPECGICFESIRKKGERFGILESCDHAFCLTCIRGWRAQREQQDRQNLRLCPVCRNESFFVVPSDDISLDPVEKSLAIEAYKTEMMRIPCKLFDYGKGSCPFGSSCFYAHLNPDGTRFVPAALRWRNGADGGEVIGEVKLSDFLMRSLALP